MKFKIVKGENYSRVRRWKNAGLNAVTNPYNLLVLIALILLAYLIVVPLYQMISTSLQVAQQEMRRIPGSQEGDFTFYYWNRLLFSDVSSSLLYKPLLHSLLIASCVSVLSIVIGTLLAWLMARSDMPGKKFLSLAVIIPYMLPSWTKSMAWLSVFKNTRIGGTPGFLESIGITTPNWLAYGPFAIICVLTLHYYAYAYLLSSAALRSINSELEEMGEIAGASKTKILMRITFPLVLPAILSSFILTFSKSMGTFGVPSFLGLKVGYYTISTMLYSSVKQGNANIGYAIAMILIAIASINIFINQRAIGARRSYATIGGKGTRSNLLSLGKGRYPIMGLVILFLSIAIIAPIIILTLDTFMLQQGTYSLSNLTLHYWIGERGLFPLVYEGEPGVLVNPRFWANLWNTLKLVITTSILGTLSGQVVGYITSRGRGKLSGRLVEQLAFIPYLIPSIAFGAIYLAMFSVRHGIIPSLYGTFALLLLVSTVKHLPFASRAGNANMMQIGIELEEAAAVEGANFLQRFGRVVFPLSKRGFLSGFMLIFISIMKELDLIILIVTPTMATLPYMAFSYSNGNLDPYSNVVAVIMFLIVLFFYWMANKFGNADIAGSMGG